MAARDDNNHPGSNHSKDFDRWNGQKKILNAGVEPLYFREGEIWWVHLGVNIGYEIDGNSENFARPVIALRKYNKVSFLALPLTTGSRPSPWKLPLGIVGGKPSFAILSQLRNIDSRRLYQKWGKMFGSGLTFISLSKRGEGRYPEFLATEPGRCASGATITRPASDTNLGITVLVDNATSSTGTVTIDTTSADSYIQFRDVGAAAQHGRTPKKDRAKDNPSEWHHSR